MYGLVAADRTAVNVYCSDWVVNSAAAAGVRSIADRKAGKCHYDRGRDVKDRKDGAVGSSNYQLVETGTGEPHTCANSRQSTREVNGTNTRGATRIGCRDCEVDRVGIRIGIRLLDRSAERAARKAILARARHDRVAGGVDNVLSALRESHVWGQANKTRNDKNAV